MSSVRDENFKKNLLEIEAILSDGELIEGYFETSNYSAEKERKSPITGVSVFRYLFADEWIWNTIFVLTNKKLYLINTRENFEKVSLDEISLDKIEYIKVFKYNQEAIIKLKIKKELEIEYKPFSNKYLDVVKKMDRVKIIENKRPKTVDNNKLILAYSIGGALLFIGTIMIYIFI